MRESFTSDFANDLLAHLRRHHWLKPGDRLGVAVSGGADSVALLRAMLELRAELGIVLSVVHFNHTLRGDESEADHAFVGSLASEHGLEIHEASGDVGLRAKEKSLSTEAAAREARYEFFWELIEGSRMDRIATAHTLDDQAETVLLRLIRGTGTRGLGGIQPELANYSPGRPSRGSILRPLLETRRRNVESYLVSLGQPWREDSSNRDLRHTRNRVRKLLIPLLESDFNPEITERLADFAEIARDEEEFWEREVHQHLAANSLQINVLQSLPLALRRRAIRALVPEELALEFRHVEAMLEVAEAGDGSPASCNLPAGWTFRRDGGSVAFEPPQSPEGAAKGSREAILTGLSPALRHGIPLPVPGRVADPGSQRGFEAVRIVLASPPAGYNPEHLYAPHALPSELTIRTWQFGDRFWPAHTKAPKKLKELFQQKKIAAELRPAWPVMVIPTHVVRSNASVGGDSGSGEEVVWVQGFAAPAHLRPGPDDREAVLLREIEFAESFKDNLHVV